MKINSREKLLLVASLTIVALLVGDRLVLTPLTGAWKSRRERIDLLTQKISTGQRLLTSEKNIQDRWQFIKTNALPASISESESRVLKAVDRWAQDSRISFTSIKPQWKQNAEDYTTLECRADAFGNIQSLASFLYALETSHPIANPRGDDKPAAEPLALKVEDVAITARDSEGQQLSLGVRFTALMLTNRIK
jgi:hypothetical protein